MRILHTADWHLGKRLERFSRIEEQKTVLDEICRIADEQQVDAVIVAGDLYDHFNPNNEAIELFFKTLERLSNDKTRLVLVIAGNHDSPERIEAPGPFSQACGVILLGYPESQVMPFELESGLKVLRSDAGFLEVQLPDVKTPLRLITTPYANEFRLKKYLGFDDDGAELRQLLQEHWATLAKKYCDKKGVNLLVSHLYFSEKGKPIEEEPEGEKPIVLSVGGATAIHNTNIPKQIQYVALGHLHRCQEVAKKPCPIVYSSSPLAYSFSEAGQQKYVVLVEAEAGKKVKYEKIPLESGKQLERKTFESTAAAVEWLLENQETWVELTMKTATYLDGQELKQLREAHGGIVKMIPLLDKAPGEEEKEEDLEKLDLSRGMEELFVEYFKHKNGGQEPSEELLYLFKELL